MGITAITYANKRFEKAARLNIKTAMQKGRADITIKYGPEDIDSEFYVKNKSILEQEKGNGYWLWKPYFIYKTLLDMKEDDYLVYTDAGVYYMNDLHLLIDVMRKNNTDKMFFQMENGRDDARYTKQDAWILLDGNYERDAFSSQVWAGIMLLKNNSSNRKLIKEWLDYCCDPRIITDSESVLGEEKDVFVAHRHDQSVLSLLLKRYGIMKFKDPSQWGRKYEDAFPNDVIRISTYPQMINAHRIPNATSVLWVKVLQTDFVMKLQYKINMRKANKKQSA